MIDSRLLECHQICHKLHFVNNYLQYGKTGKGKPEGKIRQRRQYKQRGETPPKAVVARALQRMSLLLMSGYLINPLSKKKTKEDEPQNKFSFINSIVVSLKHENYDALFSLGYGIYLRNWIQAETNKLEIVKPKPAKKTQVETKNNSPIIEDLQKQLDYQQHRTRKQLGNLNDRISKTKETIGELQAKYENLEETLCASDEVIRKHERRFEFFFKCIKSGDFDRKTVNFMDPPAEG